MTSPDDRRLDLPRGHQPTTGSPIAADDAIAAIAALSCWNGPIEIEALSGGLSNLSFRVHQGRRKFVARVGVDIPVHHVDRLREVAVSQAAAVVGVSPALTHFEPGIMIFEFIEGKTCTEAMVRARAGDIARLLKHCHANLHRHFSGTPYLFWVFHVLRDYAAALIGQDSRLSTAVPRLAGVADVLESLVGEVTLCGCHGDLLAANIIDDGQRLWLVDWEYGGYGAALFDLANIAALSSFAPADEIRLLEDYYESPATDRLMLRFHAMRCAAHLREAMWSMMSEIHLDRPVDYVAYTTAQLNRFEAFLTTCRERYGKEFGDIRT